MEDDKERKATASNEEVKNDNEDEDTTKSKLKKQQRSARGTSTALDRLRAAKASLEEQKGKSASARTYKAHTMSSTDRNAFLQLRDQMAASSSASSSSLHTSAESPSSPTRGSAAQLKSASSSDFLRRLREEKLGWSDNSGNGDAKAQALAPVEAAEPTADAVGQGSQVKRGSSVGTFFIEERKRMQQSGGSQVRPQPPSGEASEPVASVLDVLQAGSAELASKEEKQEKKPVSGLRPTAWLSATEQKRSLSTIKRTKEEKLKALEQLQSQLQQKRADINAHKEKQQHNDELLAKMVSKSIIIAPVVARGSRLVGKSIIVPRKEDAADQASSQAQPASKSADVGARLASPRLTVTPSSADDVETSTLKKKKEKEKEKEALLGTKEADQKKVKELKKKKREEKMMDDMERQLLKESKKMDEEKKNLQIDNQLSTFLTSLLTLESGFRTVEKEKIEALKKLDAADREREYLGTFLVCLLENLKRVNDGMRDVINSHYGEQLTPLLDDIIKRQQEMEEIVSATTSFVGSTQSAIPSGEQSSTGLSSSSSSTAALPSLSSFSSFASLSDLRAAQTSQEASLSTPSSEQAVLTSSSSSLVTPPPAPPPAATPGVAPPQRPPLASGTGSNGSSGGGGGESRGAMLAQIRTGGFDLKKVERRPPAPPPPSTAGNLFQSLQDTLVAAMNVRKLAMQGDEDEPDDSEWD